MICGMTYINRILLAVRVAMIIADEEYKESCRITLKDVKDMMQLHVEYMDV